jgi:predicted DNA-binding transcriptional regulator YafY
MKKSELGKVKRARRMLTMYLLLRRRPVGLRELSFVFKRNERSIQRDIALLKEAGAHIEKVNNLFFYVDKSKDDQPLPL